MAEIRAAARLGHPAWLNARTTIGLAMFVLAVVAGQSYLAQAQTTTSVWAASHDLGAGHVLDPEDVTVVEVRLDSALGGLYLTSAVEPHGLLTRSIASGELIPEAAVDQEGDPASVPGGS